MAFWVASKDEPISLKACLAFLTLTPLVASCHVLSSAGSALLTLLVVLQVFGSSGVATQDDGNAGQIPAGRQAQHEAAGQALGASAADLKALPLCNQVSFLVLQCCCDFNSSLFFGSLMVQDHLFVTCHGLAHVHVCV